MGMLLLLGDGALIILKIEVRRRPALASGPGMAILAAAFWAQGGVAPPAEIKEIEHR